MDKEIQRQKTEKVRKNQSPTNINKKSKLIIKRLEKEKAFQKNETLFCYISLPQEVKTLEFIKEHINNKKIVVPKIEINTQNLSLIHLSELENLSPSHYKILEPKEGEQINPKDINLWILPGVAFDLNGNRIGFGKGYFDKILSQYNSTKIALAFDFQILAKIDPRPHDIPVDLIITETRVINCHKSHNHI